MTTIATITTITSIYWAMETTCKVGSLQRDEWEKRKKKKG
jgi:hypothetical protein